MAFQEQLAIGQIGESAIAQWLCRRGSHVLPAYEKQIDIGKGPRLFGPGGQLVTPDLFVFPSLEFIEAKHKSVFSWHHITKSWVTGIDLNHYADYREVALQTERRVWLFFLHRQSTPDRIDADGRAKCPSCRRSPTGSCCPATCPTGLFAGSLSWLCDHESHRHANHGRHGMVYWAHDTLRCIATLAEVDSAADRYGITKQVCRG